MHLILALLRQTKLETELLIFISYCITIITILEALI